MKDLDHQHIVLGLCGSIACYKSAELCRLLVQAGATVQVVMTQAATQFITPMTMQALSQRPVLCSQWDVHTADPLAHIHLSREADVCLIAPCSANFIAKLAHGQADDLLSLLCLARPISAVPLLLAPAMNPDMWHHPATQRNLATVAADGATVLGVGCGDMACGQTGDGRMLEPAQLLDEVIACLQPKVLAGKRVLITAGPTFEAIDPVRGITNLSSGKMGFAIARAAREAGAMVTLVAGPVSLNTPHGVQRVDVLSACEMLQAVSTHIDHADVLIATAAVADWRPVTVASHKIKKDTAVPMQSLVLTENPDILATVAQSPRALRRELYCVGFAAESQDLLAQTQAKRERKGVPLMVGNIGPATFGQDNNTLLVVDDVGHREFSNAPKLSLARRLIAEIACRMGG